MAEHEGPEPASSWHRWTAASGGAGGLFEPANREVSSPGEDDVPIVDEGDVEVEDDLAELLPGVPLLPSIAGRVDALDGQLRAISMRLDVLGSAVAALRQSLGDRIDAYAEAAAGATRQTDDALEEHRRATVDLRKGIAHHDETLRRVTGLLEEVRSLVEVVVDTMPASAEGTGTDLADRVADAVVARLQQHFELVADDPDPAG